MKRIKLSKYIEPYNMVWEDANNSEFFDYYPEQEFYYFKDMKYIKIGNMPYLDVILLQFYAVDKELNSVDKMFKTPVNVRERLYRGLFRVYDEIKDEASCKLIDSFREVVVNDYNAAIDANIIEFQGLSYKDKLERFKHDFPNKYKVWSKKTKYDIPIYKFTEDRIEALYNNSFRKQHRYDVCDISELADAMNTVIKKNKLKISKEYEKYKGYRIFTYSERTEEEKYGSKIKKLLRRIYGNFAWFRFKWWQKHVLFNTAEYSDLKGYDTSIKSAKDLSSVAGLRAKNIRDKYLHPESMITGYLDGPWFFTTGIENALTSTALYMFFFGHVVHLTQRKHIREMWYARKLLRLAEDLDNSSFKKEVEYKVTSDWKKGVSITNKNGNMPLSIINMNYMLNTHDGTGSATMESIWVVDTTETESDVSKITVDENDKFHSFTKDDVKNDLFASIGLTDGHIYSALNKDYQSKINADREYYSNLWASNINERINDAYRLAFDYISDNFRGWWD